MNKHEAIRELNSSVVNIKGDTAYDVDGNEVSYNEAEVQALVDSRVYRDNRKGEYPDIGDQLDALFHAGVFPEDMASTIQAVKDKYPKEGT